MFRKSNFDTYVTNNPDKCTVITLCAGDVLLLPPIWLHAVETLEDTIVFGTNFVTEATLTTMFKEYRSERSSRTPKLNCFQNLWPLAILYFKEKKKAIEDDLLRNGGLMDDLMDGLAPQAEMKSTLKQLSDHIPSVKLEREFFKISKNQPSEHEYI